MAGAGFTRPCLPGRPRIFPACSPMSPRQVRAAPKTSAKSADENQLARSPPRVAPEERQGSGRGEAGERQASGASQGGLRWKGPPPGWVGSLSPAVPQRSNLWEQVGPGVPRWPAHQKVPTWVCGTAAACLVSLPRNVLPGTQLGPPTPQGQGQAGGPVRACSAGPTRLPASCGEQAWRLLPERPLGVGQSTCTPSRPPAATMAPLPCTLLHAVGMGIKTTPRQETVGARACHTGPGASTSAQTRWLPERATGGWQGHWKSQRGITRGEDPAGPGGRRTELQGSR